MRSLRRSRRRKPPFPSTWARCSRSTRLPVRPPCRTTDLTSAAWRRKRLPLPGFRRFGRNPHRSLSFPLRNPNRSRPTLCRRRRSLHRLHPESFRMRRSFPFRNPSQRLIRTAIRPPPFLRSRKLRRRRLSCRSRRLFRIRGPRACKFRRCPGGRSCSGGFRGGGRLGGCRGRHVASRGPDAVRIGGGHPASPA